MEGFSSNCPNWKAPMGNHGSDFKNYRENTALQFMFDIFHPLQICIKFCFIPLNLHHFLYGKSKNFRQGRAFGEGPGFYPPWGDFGIFTLGWRYCYFSTPGLRGPVFSTLVQGSGCYFCISQTFFPSKNFVHFRGF